MKIYIKNDLTIGERKVQTELRNILREKIRKYRETEVLCQNIIRDEQRYNC